jgi:ABC-2 type transport system ATP-binding protein
MIEVTHLSKNYGRFEAVRDVSFSVDNGQILGFLGPNGAGKTTIMKILTGFHFPSGGQALVDGVNVAENPVLVKSRIGYLPESAPAYGELTVMEYLNFMADAKVAKGKRRAAVEKAIEECGLTHMAGKRIETLSKGFRQRTGLAQAILHDPPILVLDEPTTGLDPNQIIEIRQLIRGLGKSKTVILSTHILQEVDAVCSQVLIINHGRIAAQGRPDEIAARLRGGETWRLSLKAAPEAVEEKRGDLAALVGGMENTAIKPDSEGLVSMEFFVPAGSSNNEENEEPVAEKIFDWAIAAGFKILLMNREKMSLEDIFVELTK